MTVASSRWRHALGTAFIAVPIFSLLLNAVAWLRYGIDLPFLDDFRAYERQTALSLDLKDLFTPSNDTLYPVGMALDVLAQRFLNGNSIAYQLLSMLGLLGGLLWLQWRLLSSAVQDRLIAAAAFSLCVFMLQPGSYWGLQNLAYHQGLPTLFLLGAIAIVVDRTWGAWWGIPAVFVLGLLAGLSYISGAFGSLAAALTLLCFATVRRPRDPALLWGGLALLAAAALTVPAQTWVIVSFQHGHVHDPRATWALPIDGDFWLFMFGKIGRALALRPSHAVRSLIIVGGVVTIAIILGAIRVIRFFKDRPHAPEESRLTIVFTTLSVTIFMYLAMLAAGRTNLRPEDISAPLDVFAFGFQNYFHFFWVTLLFPWIAAVAFAALKTAPLPRLVRPTTAEIALVAAVILSVAFSRTFSHLATYRVLHKERMDTEVHCVQEALDRGAEINCPRMAGADFTSTLTYARKIGSSFVRHFHRRAIPLGTDNPAPLYRLSTAPLESLELSNVASPTRTAEGFLFAPTDAPSLVFALPAGTLRQCRDLEVTGMIKTQHNDIARLYLMPFGMNDFVAPPAASASVFGSETGFTPFTLSVQRRDGFTHRLRVDPVGGPQPFIIKDLEVRCRAEHLETPAVVGQPG